MQPCIRFANIDDLSSLLDIEKLSFSQHEYDLLNKKNYKYYFNKSNSDIRICEFNKKPIFANKYYMAEGHWQIYNHDAKKASKRSGYHESVYLNQVPKKVLLSAVDVSKLIGDGLYGVDLKEQENGDVFVIEINDNPNIDHGVEDLVYGDDIYRNIINHLISKIEE